MRTLLGLVAGASLVALGAASPARADDLTATRGQALTEVSHTVTVSIDDGVARYVVRRTFANAGTRAEQGLLRIELPHGAAATGLRIRARDRWYDGELMEAEEARDKYRELTGMGLAEAKDPALLEWMWADAARLWVFPVLPGAVSTVEYTLTAPLEYREGNYVVSYPRPQAPADPTIASNLAPPVVTIEPGYGDARTEVVVAGHRVAPGAAVVLTPPPEPEWVGDGEPEEGVGYVHSPLAITRKGDVVRATVNLEIDHTYASDLRVELVAPDGTRHDVTRGDSDDNDIRGDFEVDLGTAMNAAGDWTVVVGDHAGLDVGTLDAWSLALHGADEAAKPIRAAAPGLPRFIPDAADGNGAGTHAVVEIEPPKIRTADARLGRVVASDAHGFSRLEIDAAPALGKIPRGAHVVFVVDVSRSHAAEEVDTQLRIAEAYLAHVPDAHVQVVTFDRTARRLFADFVDASTFDTELAAARAAGKLERANGSALEEGLRVAAEAIEGRKGPTRIVAMTDAALRARFLESMAHRALRAAPRGSITHVLVPYEDDIASVTRDDEHALAPIAARHHGVLFGVAMPVDAKRDTRVAAALPLVRPVSIDHFAVDGLDLSGARDVPQALKEGAGYRAMLGMPDPPTKVVITGKLWAEPFRQVVRHDAHFDRATAAFVFSEDEYHELSDEEMLKVAFQGRAVSPVTSYLAIEPGVRPSTDGFEEGMIGLGSTGAFGHGGGAGTGRLGGHPSLAKLLDPVGKACAAELGIAAGWEVDLDVETTSQEIVDVVARRATHPDLETCVVEGVWATLLPGGNWPGRQMSIIELR